MTSLLRFMRANEEPGTTHRYIYSLHAGRRRTDWVISLTFSPSIAQEFSAEEAEKIARIYNLDFAPSRLAVLDRQHLFHYLWNDTAP